MGNQGMTKKPDAWESSMGGYLTSLRESNTINMFGAAPYLVRDFGLTKKEARECLQYWMENAE